MLLVNIKHRESVPSQGIAKFKRREQKTVYSTQWWSFNIIKNLHGASYILLPQTRMSIVFIKIQKLVSNGLSPTTPLWTKWKFWSYTCSVVITLTITQRQVGVVLWSENVLKKCLK